MRCTRALVRPPGRNFAQALTTARLGAPDIDLAKHQHEDYCRVLENCGVAVTVLAPDENFPDSTFVEDTAIITARGAMLARPGAPSRRGEVAAIRPALEKLLPVAAEIAPPGALDGGDVCAADGHYFIGLSARTNEAGARQLAAWLVQMGLSATLVDIRARPGLLHLKSGLAHLGGKVLAVVDALKDEKALRDYELVRVPADEDYAANCLLINGTLLVARGFPKFENLLRQRGRPVIALDLSEFRKMDGGLSCLSLRW
jgi:dimethylargininase